MLLNDANSIPGAEARVEMLFYLRGAIDSTLLDALVLRDGLELNGGFYSATPGQGYECYSCMANNAILVFVQGISSVEEGAALWNAYTGPRLSYENNPVNDILAANARSVISRQNLVARCPNREVFLCGYSAGGAIMPYLVQQLLSAGVSAHFHIITFGAPRSGGRSQAEAMANFDYCRWFCDDDAVPLIPPPLGSSQRIFAGLSVFQGWNVANYRSSGHGINIDPLGNCMYQLFPSVASANPVGAVAQWLWEQQNLPSTGHSLPHYLGRLRAGVSAMGARYTPDTGDGTGGGGDDGPPVTRSAVVRNYDAVQQSFHGQLNDVGPGQVVIPSAQLFSVVRQGRYYYVAFGESLVTLAPGKKRAHHLARVGNEFLRSLSAEGSVNPERLLEQFTAYLTVAVLPDTGFVPQLNVGKV